MDVVMGFAQMAGLAIVSVSLWTLRVALASRGRRVAGSLTAGTEAIVFVVAFSRVTSDLGAVEKLLGYAVGVAIGTLVGMFLDEHLSAGQSEVRMVTEGSDQSHVFELQAAGWPVTWVSGRGPNGDVTIAFVAVDDKRLTVLVSALKGLRPDAFWTVEHLRTARAGTVQPGWLQVGQVAGFHMRPLRQHAGARS
jgi:uncharacterized protein YebE (UPF0316 family)